jgi:hypothetical protein
MRAFKPGGERRLLQLLVAALAVVPILSGLSGAVLGSDMFGSHVGLSRTGDSHLRYLSGLILAIGLGFWSTVPRIELQGTRFRLLTLVKTSCGNRIERTRPWAENSSVSSSSVVSEGKLPTKIFFIMILLWSETRHWDGCPR